MGSQPPSRVSWDPSQYARAVLGLIVLAVVGFWPVLNAHPLMDDHLFFSWLARTPWREALWQRLTANWIPDFPQLQMYRPVSGLWQVITYHFFQANALPHHLLNLLLHGGTCLLAGALACGLTGNRKTGWLAGGLMLVHPRAALGVSLIFNFTDILSAFLMMLSLVVLYAVRQDESRSRSALEGVKKSEITAAPLFPLTPGLSPHWGEGNPSTVPPCTRGEHRGVFNSIAPIEGEGGRRSGEGVIARRWESFCATPFKGGLGPIVILWASVGLALGTKEVCLPIVVVLLAAELLWASPGRRGKKAIICHAGLLVLWLTYLLARTYFIGHPFRTHHPELGFPLPAHSERWTIFWDCLLIALTLGGTLLIFRWQELRRQLPPSSDWMLLWSGCMLLPAVHFCSQMTLRPWFFDERYWYVPLVPLSVLAAALLTHGTKLSSALGAAILAITLPGAMGLLIAGMAFLAIIPFLNNRTEPEVQRTIATLFLVAIALVLWQRCGQISLRADEAAGLHMQLKRVILETPPQSPIALLEFTEPAAEPSLSLNGAFQWLLTPPFFPENVSDRFFCAYPTWDFPPTNRFWDRTTSHLLEKMDAGQEVSLYSWNTESREFRSLGQEKRSTPVRPVLPIRTVPMEPVSALDSSSNPGEFKASWHSIGSLFDPRFYRVLALRLTTIKSEIGSVPLEIELSWVSERSLQWSAAKEIRVHCPSSPGSTGLLSGAEVWLYPGRRVDWLLGGGIIELRVTANQPLALERVQISSSLPESVVNESEHIDEYASPGMKFLWETESWWNVGQ